MNSGLNNWISGAARFLTGSPDDGPKAQRTESPTAGDGDQNSGANREGVDNAARVPPVSTEAVSDAEVAVSTPGPVEEDMAPVTSPEVSVVTAIHEQVSSLAEQLAVQGSVLVGIGAQLESACEREKLLEGQAETMRALSERVKELESQATLDLVVRPMLKDWISLYDSLLARVKSAPVTNNGLITTLKEVSEEVLATLERYDVKRIAESTNELDIRKQQVVKTVVVDQLKDNQIVDRPRPGFAHRGQIIRYEHVVVQKIRA